MAHTPHRTMERRCDVAVIGGSAAGLAAALQLGRQRRTVIVIDAGEPRNAPAAHMHGYLGHEGLPPLDLTGIGREEVRSYGGEVLDGMVVQTTRTDDGRFRLELTGGHSITARAVLLATGLTDLLPDIDGVAEHWGRDVIHCPFCHGYEVRDQQVVQIVTHPMGLHPAPLFRALTDRLSVVIDPSIEVDDSSVEALERNGVAVLRATVERISTDSSGHLDGVVLTDAAAAGTDRLDADAVVVGPTFRPNASAVDDLAPEISEHFSGLGDVVVVDASGETSVPGLFAAGNVADPSQQVLQAAANGSWVGARMAFALAAADLADDDERPTNEVEWDDRYSSERVWSGNPNGNLVVEVSEMTPGTVLDVGAGEGGDAVWLATHGWAVTASDVSQRALDRIAAEATAQGLDIELIRSDANTADPFDGRRFDLVSVQYPSMTRTPDQRAVHNLIDAVAPGGTLLVVAHDPEPMNQPVNVRENSRVVDHRAHTGTDEIAAVLSADPEWTIDSHRQKARPVGAASTHHVDDIILRAVRRR